MHQRKPLKLNLPLENAEQHISRILAREGGGTVERTAYAITLNTEKRRYYFADQKASDELFSALAMVKKDIDERLAQGLLWTEHATPAHIAYHYLPAKNAQIPSECYSVDIKGAYPNTARLIGLIGKETYERLMTLPKAQRLKVLGMLATRKYTETFKGVNLVSTKAVESPYRAWFFDLCAYVGSVMEEVRKATPPDLFVLYWVDGAFTNAPEIAEKILTEAGYEFSTEKVRNMRKSEDGRYIHFTKGEKSTYLCLPKRHEIDAESIKQQLKKAHGTGLVLEPSANF